MQSSLHISSESGSPHQLSSDFWKLWAGQAISVLGSSFTVFALPLLVFKLTGSALHLAYSAAAGFLPYLMFGLLIGAWVDRVDRKRLMILTDLGRAAVVSAIPLLAMMNRLDVWWIYVVLFINSTLGIGFDAAKYAAVPSLVDKDDLVLANGRIQASYSTMTILGPLLAGLLVAIMPIYQLLIVDILSFVVSAILLMLITVSFNAPGKRRGKSIVEDVFEGLRYVFGHPVLRNISIMMAIVNLANTNIWAQRVLYAKEQLRANDSEVAIMAAAGGLGVVTLSLVAGKLRKRYSFSKVALGALMLGGLTTIAMALTTSYWAALPLWALFAGLGILFNINTNSLRQAIAPNYMLGRVMTVAGVLAWSANPLGAFVGGWVIERTHNLTLLYIVVGLLTITIPAVFAFTPLGRAERYIPQSPEDSTFTASQPSQVDSVAEGASQPAAKKAATVN